MAVASNDKGAPSLLLQAEKLLTQPIHPHFLRCCPTMDLIAVVTTDERLDVYRFNGQRAFGLQRRSGSDALITSICWKYDGRYLALGWSDGTLEVVSAAIGNAVQQFKQVTAMRNKKSQPNEHNSQVVSCIGWAMNFVQTDAVKKKLGSNPGTLPTDQPKVATTDDWDEEKADVTLEDFLDRVPDPDRLKIPISLPDQLSRIDILAQLPKLPVLPLLPSTAYSSGYHSAAELFASQISLDAAIHTTQDRHHNELDILLLCREGGDVRLVLYDSLTLGDVTLADACKPYRVRHLKHTYHPLVRSHAFLSELHVDGGPSKLALVSLTLKYLESAGSHLQLIESKTAQLQLLVQYVGECLLALDYHWKHAKELPAKFTAIVTEDLKAKDDATLPESLFHLACTGHCPPVLKEWLIDSLAERGHKRWDHAISQGYTKVLELTHENLIPALDRCDMILAGLKGLFDYHSDHPGYNVVPASFTMVTDIIKSMRLLAHHVLVHGAREFRQFAQFSKWLRHEIDVQATDPLSSTADETLEKESDVDINLLLEYIKGPLELSQLDLMLRSPAASPLVVINENRYQDVKKALQSKDHGAKTNNLLDLLVIGSHFNEWHRHNEELTILITSWQRSNCVMDAGLVVEEGGSRGNDVRIVYEMRQDHQDSTTTYIAQLPAEDAARIHLYRLVGQAALSELKNPRSGLECCQLRFEGGVVEDVQFVDDELLLILLFVKETTHLLKLAYRPDSVDAGSISLQPPKFRYYAQSKPIMEAATPYGHAPKFPTLQTLRIHCEANLDSLKLLIMHTFPNTDRFRPKKIEANGRKDRRVIVLLGEDGRQLRVYDLDFGVGADTDFGDHGMSDSSSDDD